MESAIVLYVNLKLNQDLIIIIRYIFSQIVFKIFIYITLNLLVFHINFEYYLGCIITNLLLIVFPHKFIECKVKR